VGRGSRLCCRAAGPGDDGKAEIGDRKTDLQSLEEENARKEEKVKEAAEVARGQRLAVITGAVSIIFGVLYLIGVQVLGSREMLPPPPEALL